MSRQMFFLLTGREVIRGFKILMLSARTSIKIKKLFIRKYLLTSFVQLFKDLKIIGTMNKPSEQNRSSLNKNHRVKLSP